MRTSYGSENVSCPFKTVCMCVTLHEHFEPSFKRLEIMRHNSQHISLHNNTGNPVGRIVRISLPPQVKGRHSMAPIYWCLLCKNRSAPPTPSLLLSPPSPQPTQLKSEREGKKRIAALQVLLITLIKNRWHNGSPQLQRKAGEINKRLICCVVDVTFIIQVKVKQRAKPKYANGDLATWGSCTNTDDWLNIPRLLLLRKMEGRVCDV